MPKPKKKSSRNLRTYLTEQNLSIVLCIVLLLCVGLLLTRGMDKSELTEPITIEQTTDEIPTNQSDL